MPKACCGRKRAPAWPPFASATERAPGPAARVGTRTRRAWLESEFHVATYLCMLAFGTHLAAPFFTPYMLRELSLDYRTFAALSATSILAKAVAFSCCHRLAGRVGLERLLAWSGAGVALTPFVWACSSELGVLIFAHVLGGAVWAAVEYTSYQLLLDKAPAELTAEYRVIRSAWRARAPCCR